MTHTKNKSSDFTIQRKESQLPTRKWFSSIRPKWHWKTQLLKSQRRYLGSTTAAQQRRAAQSRALLYCSISHCCLAGGSVGFISHQATHRQGTKNPAGNMLLLHKQELDELPVMMSFATSLKCFLWCLPSKVI